MSGNSYRSLRPGQSRWDRVDTDDQGPVSPRDTSSLPQSRPESDESGDGSRSGEPDGVGESRRTSVPKLQWTETPGCQSPDQDGPLLSTRSGPYVVVTTGEGVGEDGTSHGGVGREVLPTPVGGPSDPDGGEWVPLHGPSRFVLHLLLSHLPRYLRFVPPVRSVLPHPVRIPILPSSRPDLSSRTLLFP